MKIEGREKLQSEVALVWEALDGTAAYKACLPAIAKLDEVSPGRREATIDLKLPAISGVFDGSIEVLEREENQRMQLRIEGEGKPGVINGTVEILLEATAEGTVVTYVADVQVGGQIARLGQRMIGVAAKEMAAEFFGNMDQYVDTGGNVSLGNPIVRMLSFIFRTLRGLLFRT